MQCQCPCWLNHPHVLSDMETEGRCSRLSVAGIRIPLLNHPQRQQVPACELCWNATRSHLDATTDERSSGAAGRLLVASLYVVGATFGVSALLAQSQLVVLACAFMVLGSIFLGMQLRVVYMRKVGMQQKARQGVFFDLERGDA